MNKQFNAETLLNDLISMQSQGYDLSKIFLIYRNDSDSLVFMIDDSEHKE